MQTTLLQIEHHEYVEVETRQMTRDLYTMLHTTVIALNNKVESSTLDERCCCT